MKIRVFLLALTLAACRRDEFPEPPTTTSAAPGTTSAAAPVAPVVPPPAISHSTPTKCAGDGSYPQAIDCFRSAAGFHFTFEEDKQRAEGEMSRPTPGAERVHFRSGSEDWIGITDATGVRWYRNGKRVSETPSFAEHLYQRATLFLDPQKKEGLPQPQTGEKVAGEDCHRYRFTDANNGSAYEAWVSKNDGHLVRFTIQPSATLRSAFPPLSMTVTKFGEAAKIEEPR